MEISQRTRGYSVSHSCAFKFIAAALNKFPPFFSRHLRSNVGIDGSDLPACDLFIPAAVETKQHKRSTIHSHSRLVLSFTVTYLNASPPEKLKATPDPQPTRRGAARHHRSGPRRRHDAAAAFLAARRLLLLTPAGGPRTVLPSSSSLLSSQTKPPPSLGPDADSSLRLRSSRWKTGWRRSRSSNIRSRRRARRRQLQQRQRQRRAKPRRRHSRTP